MKPFKLKYSDVCPACGAVKPSDDIAGTLPPKQQMIFELIRAAGARGISAREIFDLAYGSDPNGGPACDRTVVPATTRVINMKIYKHRLMIKAKRGPGGRYRLLKLP